jgi:phage tail sheath protein FI
MAEPFHGVKVTEKLKGVIPFIEVFSAIIGLVGTSPLGKKDEILVVRNWEKLLKSLENQKKHQQSTEP